MVDLPTGKTAMRNKKRRKARSKYIEPDDFHLARRRAGLTVQAAAEELDVDVRTIRNYENGAVRIPYSAFRVMRSLAYYPIAGHDWEDWCFWQNKLWTPEGRSFEAHELRYVATFIQLARHFLRSRSANAEERSTFGAESTIEVIPFVSGAVRDSAEPKAAAGSTLAREPASAATAASGAGLVHDTAVEFERPPVSMEKAA